MKNLNEDFYNNLIKKIKPYFEKTGGHNFDHTNRVYKNAIKISENENIDLDIVKTAALLHDIARLIEGKNNVKCHAKEGARMSKEILKKVGFPEEKIDSVSYAIRVHRYSKGIKPETKEAAILQDADRLDALGALTIARIFEFGGKNGRRSYDPEEDPEEEYISNGGHSSITHFHRKILKITPDKFHTKKAREIAKERYNFVKEFVKRYKKEWEGEL
jgi:uncharacterized protein